MVYKVGHSAHGSEASRLDGTDKSLQNWNIATSAEDQENQNILCKKCKTKHLNFFYFIRFGVYIIYLNRLHMFWYCLMLVSKKISLMYIFDKLTWAAIGFLVYRITACWFGSASNFTLYMTMFSLNWTNRFPSPKRHLKPKDFYKVIKGQPYWACHLAKWGM